MLGFWGRSSSSDIRITPKKKAAQASLERLSYSNQ